MDYNVGDIVLCVNDSFPHKAMNYFKSLPIKHKIYTIRQIKHHSNGEIGFLLEEIINPLYEGNSIREKYEPKFKSTRFKKIDTPSIENILKELELVVEY
jgi:hypothetical protein